MESLEDFHSRADAMEARIEYLEQRNRQVERALRVIVNSVEGKIGRMRGTDDLVKDFKI